MAQLIVRNLEDDVRDRLRALAAEHGRSMEEEVREILREAALRASIDDKVQLGTRLVDRFRTHSLEGEIEELRGQPAKPANLKP
jgi:plasmid stability protein